MGIIQGGTCQYLSQQQVIRMGARILSESTIDKDSLVPRLGPSARSGRELEREGGTVPERVDEGGM